MAILRFSNAFRAEPRPPRRVWPQPPWPQPPRKLRPKAVGRTRRQAEQARLAAEMDQAARKLARDIVKRRARAFLANADELEMIAEGLSRLSPADLLARLEALRRATRSLRARPDPLAGRVDALNLGAAKLAARYWRRRRNDMEMRWA